MTRAITIFEKNATQLKHRVKTTLNILEAYVNKHLDTNGINFDIHVSSRARNISNRTSCVETNH